MTDIDKHYNKLDELPSLPKDWIRLVHRLRGQSLGKDVIQNIKDNGLIFNRSVANPPPSQRGGTYPSPGYMVSAYNEELFWEKLKKDDFFVFDDAKYADTQIVFDMPMDEYCFLEKFGRVAVGKIDPKYIVGVIPNYNGYNKKLTLPKEEVERAKQKSQNNPPAPISPDGLDTLILKLQERFKTITKAKIEHSIETEREYILYNITEELKDIRQKTSPSLINELKSKER